MARRSVTPRREPASAHGDRGDLRDRLLAAALQEIDEVGVDDISLRSLARKVGVSHQAPIHVFGSRRGLLTALATIAANHLAEETARAAREVERNGGAGPDAVLAIGLTYIEIALGQRALFALATRAESLDLTDPDLLAARAAAWAVLHDAVRRAQDGGWRAGQPTDLVAMMCWSMVQGIAVIYRDELAPGGLTDQPPEDLARALAELI